MVLKHRDLLKCRFKKDLGRGEFELLYWVNSTSGTIILLSLSDSSAYVLRNDDNDYYITSDNLSSLCDFDDFDVIEVNSCEIKPIKVTKEEQ